ncbi:ATP-binding protein [Glaciimonas sp. GNP009]
MIKHDENKPFSTHCSQPGSPNGTSSVQLLGQYYQWILYGGATLFTFVALVAGLIAVAMYTENFVHAQRLLFDDEQRQVEIRVITANAKMRQAIVRQEFLHKQRQSDVAGKATANLIPLERFSFIQHTARNIAINAAIDAAVDTAVSKSDITSGTQPAVTSEIAANAVNNGPAKASTEMLVLTALNVAKPSAKLATLLTQFYDVSPNVVMNTLPAVEGSYVMLYDKKKTFLGLHAPQTEMSAKSLQSSHRNPMEIRAAIVKAVAPVEAALQTIPAAKLRAGKTIWIAPYKDPLSGKLIISRAAVTFHGDSAFSVLVISTPVDLFDQHFLLQPLPAGFGVIASNGIVLSGAVSDDAGKQSPYQQKTSSSRIKKYSDTLKAFFDGRATLVTLSHPIRDTGWTMVYTFNWRMLWDVLHHKIYFALGVALMLSIILWTAVFFFNRLAFIPVIREALRVHDSEAFNRAMMGVAPLGFFVLNYPTGELILANEQARHIASQSHAFDEITSFHQRLMACYKNQGQSGAGDQTLAHDVLELSAADGTCTFALAAFTRTRYLRNDVLLCCLSDITSQKCAERALQRAKIEADQANKAKSMFLALISHEIRTPLHGATGHLELLEMAPLASSERELVQTIRGSFESLLRIINDILDISRIEAGKLSLEIAPFNLRDAVASCTHLWTPALESKSVDFQCRITSTVPENLVGDAGRIAQILNNLLSNAVKFTHVGNIILDISGSSHPDGYTLQIGIRDSGIGIATEDQKRLFTPFSQANSSIAREFGGTGLGLSLCKQLIDAMQGKITIQSEYGAGTIVLVTLVLGHAAVNAISQPIDLSALKHWRIGNAIPITAIRYMPSISLSQIHAQPQEPIPSTVLRVLVVEDDPVSKKLLERQLYSLGQSNVDFVDNGKLALALATSAPSDYPYDLILTDMNLPHMSGYELISSLRQHGLDTPIIVTSASGENDQTVVIRPQIDAYLTKPISLVDLKNALARYFFINSSYAPQSTGTKRGTSAFEASINQAETLAATFNDNLGSSIVDDDIAKIFLDTYRQDLRSLLLAFQNREFGALDGALHRLKGALLAIQEDGLAQLSEQICHDSHRNPCVPTVIGLRKFVKNLLKVVRNLRTSLNANDLKNE